MTFSRVGKDSIGREVISDIRNRKTDGAARDQYAVRIHESLRACNGRLGKVVEIVVVEGIPPADPGPEHLG